MLHDMDDLIDHDNDDDTFTFLLLRSTIHKKSNPSMDFSFKLPKVGNRCEQSLYPDMRGGVAVVHTML